MQQTYACPTCGNIIGYGDRFCGSCGTTLEWPAQQPQQPAYPPPPVYPQQPVYQQPPAYPQQPVFSPQNNYPPMTGYQPPPMNRPPPMQQPGWGQQQQWGRPTPPPPPVWNQPPPPPPAWGPPQQGWGGYPQQPPAMPGYGQAAPPKQGSSVGLIFLTLLVIVVMGGGILMLLTKGSFDVSSLLSSSGKTPAASAPAPGTTPTGTTPTPAPAPEATPAVVVTSKALVDEYKADKAAADAKYKNKRIQVSGVVASTDVSAPYIILTSGSPDEQGAKCVFTKGDSSDISTIELAKNLTIEGKVVEFNIDVQLVECTFIKR